MSSISPNLFIKSLANSFYHYHWVHKLKHQGFLALGRVTANSYLPNGWEYSGNNRYVDIQVQLITEHTTPSVRLVACKIGQAMHLPVGTIIHMHIDTNDPQRAVFIRAIETDTSDDLPVAVLSL